MRNREAVERTVAVVDGHGWKEGKKERKKK
jgi:hypothetical protein